MKYKLYFEPQIIEANDEAEANRMCETGEYEVPLVNLIEEITE